MVATRSPLPAIVSALASMLLGLEALGAAQPATLFAEAFECGNSRRWAVTQGGSVPPGPPVGVFAPQTVCEWTAPEVGDPYPAHTNVLATPLVADLPPGAPGSLELVVVTYNGTDGGDPACKGSDANFFGVLRLIDAATCAPVANVSGLDEKLIATAAPAIGDLDGDGIPEIVVGGDHNPPGTAGDGGLIHAFRRDLASELPGFPVGIDEVVYSSPALGDVDGDGELDLVFGTGWCWDRPACAPLGTTHDVTEAVYALDRFGAPIPSWPYLLPANQYAFGSPALADFDGDGDAEVVVNTLQKVDSGPQGWVYALEGDGTALPGWPKQPVTPATCDTQIHNGTSASAVVADLDGDAVLEIALVSNWEVVVWTPAGVQLSRDDACPDPPGDWVMTADGPMVALGVGDLDADGAAELVATGFNASGSAGRVYSWSFGAGAAGAAAPWPQFRRGQTNHARFEAGLFADDFESGLLDGWTRAVR